MDHIALPDWATSKASQDLLQALIAKGATVRFVGGCVRNYLAERPVADIDLAISVPPEKVIDLLEAAGLKAIPTGLAHGTVTALSGRESYEITTLRRDVETDGRRAKIAFTDDWLVDASRRDFTINTLSLGPDGALYDPFDGRTDLVAGRVRFVGSARQRIEEDYLRLLRFFRFHAAFGRGAPDPEGLEAATALAPKLETLSGERIRVELLKVLAGERPAPTLQIMLGADILATALPEVTQGSVLEALVAAELEPDGPDALLRLAALIDEAGSAEKAARVAERLRCSGLQRDRLVLALDPLPGLTLATDAAALGPLLYCHGRQRIEDQLCLQWARASASPESKVPAEADATLALVRAWQPKIFPLSGRDALALGLDSGPAVGDLLSAVEDWWVAAGFKPDHEACQAQLRRVMAERGGV